MRHEIESDSTTLLSLSLKTGQLDFSTATNTDVKKYVKKFVRKSQQSKQTFLMILKK